MATYIGIDPSINSTGICIQKFDGDILSSTKFFIVKPNKLTKKEQKVSILGFNYVIYGKDNIKEYKDIDTHLAEYHKTLNIINLVDAIDNIVKEHIDDNTIVVMEGISYGSSIRTKSIFDLAGLNYIIRERIITNSNLKLNICPPSEIKKFAAGKGNAGKDILTEAFMILFPEFNIIDKIDDIVDAYFMCKYAYMLNNVK